MEIKAIKRTQTSGILEIKNIRKSSRNHRGKLHQENIRDKKENLRHCIYDGRNECISQRNVKAIKKENRYRIRRRNAAQNPRTCFHKIIV